MSKEDAMTMTGTAIRAIGGALEGMREKHRRLTEDISSVEKALAALTGTGSKPKRKPAKKRAPKIPRPGPYSDAMKALTRRLRADGKNFTEILAVLKEKWDKVPTTTSLQNWTDDVAPTAIDKKPVSPESGAASRRRVVLDVIRDLQETYGLSVGDSQASVVDWPGLSAEEIVARRRKAGI